MTLLQPYSVSLILHKVDVFTPFTSYLKDLSHAGIRCCVAYKIWSENYFFITTVFADAAYTVYMYVSHQKHNSRIIVEKDNSRIC